MSDLVNELKQRSLAQVAFSGLGVWDVFKPGRILVGRVVFDKAQQ